MRRAFLLILAAGLAHAGSPYDWRSYPNGDDEVRVRVSESWLLLGGAPAPEVVEAALIELHPTAVLARYELLLADRVAIEIPDVGAKGLRDLGEALVRRHAVRATWPAVERETGVGFFDDQLAVALTSPPDAALRERLRKLGVRLSERVYRDVWRAEAHDLDSVGAARVLRGVAGVRSAEPDLIRHVSPLDLPDEPRIGDQWHLESPNDVGDIEADEAWQTTRGNHETVVAIFDTGFDMDHPELAPNIVGGFDAVGDDDDPEAGCSRSPDGAGPAGGCPGDRPFRESHGTAVAGVVAARADNGVLGAGVCPECGLFPVRLLGGSGTRSINNAAAFQRAADAGADVINNSWGPNLTRFFPLSGGERETFDRITTEARDGKGVVLVFAAGNDFFTPATANPYAAHPGVITVSASTRLDDFACYSNYGDVIAVAGPSQGCFDGESGIATSDYQGPEGYGQGDFTTGFGGTSAASPVVAGVAGLVVAANPELTAQQVRLVLQRSAEKITADKNPWQQRYGIDLEAEFAYDEHGFSAGFGYGRVNAAAAVALAATLDDRVAGVCDDDCPRCFEGRCAPDCAGDADCPGASRCVDVGDGALGCALPRPTVADPGQPCGADCELCVNTWDSNQNPARVCTVHCDSDEDCPFGFDCRTVDAEDEAQPRACIPGNQECGTVWGEERCQSELRVEAGGVDFCSCECIPGTEGNCPDGFVCSNASCVQTRGGLRCTAVSSQREANYYPSCFPDPDFEAPCEEHGQCGRGLFCIDGICQADLEPGGCDICAPCDNGTDCRFGEACVDTLRGKRCLQACNLDADDPDDACPGDSVCADLPGPDGHHCVNPEYRCEVEGRCFSDADCPEGVECSEMVCGGRVHPPRPDAEVESPDAGVDAAPEADAEADAATGPDAETETEQPKKSEGCSQGGAPAATWGLLLLLGWRRRRGR